MKPGGPSWGLWKMREELGVSAGGHHLFDAKAMKQNSFHQIPVLQAVVKVPDTYMRMKGALAPGNLCLDAKAHLYPVTLPQ